MENGSKQWFLRRSHATSNEDATGSARATTANSQLVAISPRSSDPALDQPATWNYVNISFAETRESAATKLASDRQLSGANNKDDVDDTDCSTPAIAS